jgi:hypothetical protein
MAAGSGRRRADYSPNNRGFAMATISAGLDVPVSPPVCRLGKPPIDNNQTPSYLSVSFGCLPLAGVIHVKFARKVPHSGVPEANPAETA